MIDLAVLGLVKEHPLHGYELKKRLRDLLGPLTRVSFGSLYPALARLERDGAVRALVEDDDSPSIPVPMTGSLGGEAAAFRAARLLGRSGRGRRGRKVYAITPVGEARLAELLQADDDDERTFTLKLAFARHLAAEARLALLERRRLQLTARLAEAPPGPGRRGHPLRRLHPRHPRARRRVDPPRHRLGGAADRGRAPGDGTAQAAAL